MSENFEKKNSAASERVVLSVEQVEPLLKSERWGAVEAVSQESVEGGVAQQSGADDVAAKTVEQLCERPIIGGKEIDIERLLRLSSADIIDRFLSKEHHRIVAEEGEPDSDIVVEAEFDVEEDMVSEELAEVYLAQGLKDMAKETYRKLSLVNPEKSIYFAGLIEKIDKNE